MPIQSFSTGSHLEEFEIHLKTERYAAEIQRSYLWLTRRFVDYLVKKSIAIEAVHSDEVEDFLRWELRSWRRQHRRARWCQGRLATFIRPGHVYFVRISTFS